LHDVARDPVGALAALAFGMPVEPAEHHAMILGEQVRDVRRHFLSREQGGAERDRLARAAVGYVRSHRLLLPLTRLWARRARSRYPRPVAPSACEGPARDSALPSRGGTPGRSSRRSRE